MLWLLVGLVISLIYIVVYMCTSEEDTGMRGGAYRLLIVKIPKAAKKIIYMIPLGKHVLRGIIGTKRFFFDKPNSFLQVGYLLLVTGCFYLFTVKGLPYINGFANAFTHKCIMLALVFIIFVSNLMVNMVKPGYVTKEEKGASPYEYDGIVFQKSVCRTCETIKPARSKHCAVCDVCVHRFDHHCIWLNQCVGKHNYKWFLTFLMSHVGMMVYGATLVLLILKTISERDNYWGGTYTNPTTGEQSGATWLIVVRYIMFRHTGLCGLLMMSSVMGIALGAFTIYHFAMAAGNFTTNENFKWKDVEYTVSEMKKEWKANVAAAENAGEDVSKCGGEPILPQWHYDRGIVKNLKEVFFPLPMPSPELPKKNGGRISKK
eukprot:TRINITY_DN15871_c0_g1_i1.p1 TRINITY_DN15871_c0_g1~~TRINITY_DN15871_c0_g1_i1.p1  ORF type:complete len:375 (+),score=67.55 TRINITY_DN15871_c0_g1_i1:66-1190(+)